jgi:hypothetical protein
LNAIRMRPSTSTASATGAIANHATSSADDRDGAPASATNVPRSNSAT